VSGSGYFPRFYTRYRDDPSVTVFICGGAPGVAEIARRNVNAKVSREMVKFIFKYRERLPRIRLFLPLGGTIDDEAESLKRPPPWITNAGFEWLYRNPFADSAERRP
jgi:UDP-N-acetyl-D-mannosaminuronic acid transferase (WecB/TagA/CpsF family)